MADGNGSPAAGPPAAVPPTRPQPRAADDGRTRFVRGQRAPRGVVWFGVQSFWGHAQHFIASGIATEDIDSRDWMEAEPPDVLAREIARVLGAKPTDESADMPLVDRLGRDVWVDYIADTGDDVTVSEAVGDLFARDYLLPDPRDPSREIHAPRGEVLIFGGDTAYPVATSSEILARVIVPFNRALARHPGPPGVRRVLLGIPGNHDWYDGLDGFARMFRKRVGDLPEALLRPATDVRRRGRMAHARDWVQKFILAGQVEKSRALILDGYEPVQRASYFALPLARDLLVFAVDRQLRNLDYRQRHFFATARTSQPNSRRILLLPDPVYAFLDESPSGVGMVRSLHLDLDAEPHLVIAGDIHHYQRRKVGASLHVVAGGGGAFLHPARIHRGDRAAPDVEWPGQLASRALLRQVPAHVAMGHSGLIPHLAMLAIFAPPLGVGVEWWSKSDGMLIAASMVAGVVGALVCALIGDIRRASREQAVRIALLSIASGIAMGTAPMIIDMVVAHLLARVGWSPGTSAQAIAILILASFIGASIFGAYLAALTTLGLESSQAFTALGHPGYRHFVRMRVRRDGSGVDVWCIGLEDPARAGEEPTLVDAFEWTGKSDESS